MKNYRILFLGYWNLSDGLTHSTILPHLRILKSMPQVQYLHFANTQREPIEENATKPLEEIGIPYTPLFSKNLAINQFNKIYDFIHFPKQIKLLCETHQINLIIARGAPAGSLAFLVWKKLGIPFVVESFEPHADYMRAAGVWKPWDLRYFFQKHWEEKQKKMAKALITVAKNYKHQLIKEGIAEDQLLVAPCAVDTQMFYPDADVREKMRNQFKIPAHAKVGVYAGKFGGLYLEEEAFAIFKQAFEQIPDFFLLLLTNTNTQWLQKQIAHFQLPSNRIIIDFVPYQSVNDYLNMADFAFALYKSNQVSPYLSPVKIGEYWAVGLPVIITPGLGDEKDFIEKDGLGFIYHPKKNLTSILLSSIDFDEVNLIRSLGHVKNAYQKLLLN